MPDITDWLINNIIEVIGSLLGIASIILQIKRKLAYWPVVIVMVIFYIWIYFNAKFYAYMSFQFYYLGVSIYGWHYWIKHKNSSEKGESATDINILNLKNFLILLLISAVLFAVLYFILSRLTDTDIPYGDAFTTAISCVATWLLAKKYIENWIFWIATDAVSLGLYIHKALYPTAVLYSIFLVLAVVGYLQWKKELK